MKQQQLGALDHGRPVDFTATVDKIKLSSFGKTAILTNDTSLELHRYCTVGVGDELRVTRRSNRVAVEALCINGRATILPAFRLARVLPGIEKRIVFKEAATEEDLQGFEALSKFHYRAQASFGRRAVLVGYLEDGADSSFVGYIEITNTFAGHKSRNKLLDDAFRDSSGVSWDRWNLAARNRYLNLIARISRCVVHPEFRGVGIGVALCEAAAAYCRTHWQIARLKPLFLEITADMLKFVPFAEHAGMRYIGTTSGNVERVRKDQSYLNRVLGEIESGIRDKESHSVFSAGAKSILQKQRGDVERIRQIAQEQKLDVDQMLALFLSSATPEGMSPLAYDLLNSLIRFPKPTYLLGLSADASAFLGKRLAEVPPEPLETGEISGILPKATSKKITVNDLTIRYEYPAPSSGWGNAIREAFGLDKQVTSETGVKGVNLVIEPGEVLYVWGPSGSGKTGFLEVLLGRRKAASGAITGLDRSDIAEFSTSFPERPIVDVVGVPDLKSALFALNCAGLSEAALYFKTPSMLSAGQRHRLGLARLIGSGAPVWLVDEFCSVLDDTTATIVARNFGRIARRLGVSAIVAGPRRSPVIESLGPTQVLSLGSLGTWSVARNPSAEAKRRGRDE